MDFLVLKMQRSANLLLDKEYIFDISSMIILLILCCRKTIPGLFCLSNLLKLCSDCSKHFIQGPMSRPICLFFLWWGIPVMKVMKKSRKGSVFLSTPAHILYLTTSCVLICMLTPQIYLAFKHKQLHTLVTAITLQRLPTTEAMSAFDIPNNKEAKLIHQDPWVSIAVTIITLLGIAVCLYRTCSKMTFFKGYLYENVCTLYLFISHDFYHVPLK